MLMSTALGVPRFSIMSDRRSSSTRFRSFPKFARARRAETTIVPFLPVVVGVVDINSPFQLHELYSFPEGQSMTRSSPHSQAPPLLLRAEVLHDTGIFVRYEWWRSQERLNIGTSSIKHCFPRSS